MKYIYIILYLVVFRKTLHTSRAVPFLISYGPSRAKLENAPHSGGAAIIKHNVYISRLFVGSVHISSCLVSHAFFISYKKITVTSTSLLSLTSRTRSQVRTRKKNVRNRDVPIAGIPMQQTNLRPFSPLLRSAVFILGRVCPGRQPADVPLFYSAHGKRLVRDIRCGRTLQRKKNRHGCHKRPPPGRRSLSERTSKFTPVKSLSVHEISAAPSVSTRTCRKTRGVSIVDGKFAILLTRSMIESL